MKGELVVLGRNGSLITLLLCWPPVYARTVTIWTDVDGVYLRPAPQVPDARLLKSMSYRERWSFPASAQVLHPAYHLPDCPVPDPLPD